MSMHKIPLTPIEEAGLRAHGLDIGKPSQLSDAFRQGVRYASAQLPRQGGEAVATIQLPDIYDERDGLWLSREDMQRLEALPAGTKLYTHPADQVADGVVVPRVLRSVLAMILNALDRDAAEGKQARGEMAQELRALMEVKP